MTAVVLFAALSVSSPAFQQNGSIPPEFTCDGAGRNPALEIGGVPAGAKSLALIVFDPDVPKAIKSDGRYLHWALWNLEPTSAVIGESRGGGLSEGGRSGWVPPCPPNGEHRYVFQAFALDVSKGGAKVFLDACFNYPTLGDLYKLATADALLKREKLGRDPSILEEGW